MCLLRYDRLSGLQEDVRSSHLATHELFYSVTSPSFGDSRARFYRLGAQSSAQAFVKPQDDQANQCLTEE
jgi:hypothetical protein